MARPRGALNKPKLSNSEWVQSLILKNRRRIEQGLKTMDDGEAAKVLADLSVAMSRLDYDEFLKKLCKVGVYVVNTREGCWRVSLSLFDDDKAINK